ncbi:cytochrome c oxidase subunit II [Pelagerythrobacter aerophilus]|uniref:Cytochrome c oxidase subunit 2 n=2 Tax=Pelagerythrobacter aerophilus TaxID=2306995 RepID=A0A418NK46_9SPHN|nr:cytochrome c oxidase subunit II [Pelagerythrobacter aerophilus]
MRFGDWPHGVTRFVMVFWAAIALALVPQAVSAQDAAEAPAAEAAPAEGAAAAGDAAPVAGGYEPLGPEWIKGQPTAGGWDVQDQFSPIGETASGLHFGLMWVMGIICIFVLGLLLWVVVRYRRGANPTPSKTTHNTFIEVVWTLVPVLILVGIAVPSISLLSDQYESPPKDAVTIKVTGYQWYWGYGYPDNGGFEVISNMLPEDEAKAKGLPALLAVDNRLVVPVDTPLRIQTTAADVIHSFAVPSLWFKIDAVPGRLNERLLTIEEPGIYYGQCSELCGARHGYMPIAVEALPRDQWEAWVRSQPGGTVGDEAEAAPAAPAADASAAEGEEAAAENAGGAETAAATN